MPSIEKEATLLDEERDFRAVDDDAKAEVLTPRTHADASTSPAKAIDALESSPRHLHHFVPLQMGGRNGRTHVPTRYSAALLDEIGGLAALEKMTTFFYEKAFCDETLDKFIRSHDDPHASRFARWIHQKLADSSVWDDERGVRSKIPVEVANGQTIVVHDRTSAHVAAWHSPKRHASQVGRHFKLDECRVWMRLHFWAMRVCIGNRSPAFVDYYVRFIGHFISVYEGTAPAFARDSYRWSADQANIQNYLDNGCRMIDVLGLSLGQALEQIPEDEANDTTWPYTQMVV